MRVSETILRSAAVVAFCSAALAQTMPRATRLLRTFSPGESHAYRIELVVRSDVRGSQAEKIGNKAVLRSFDRFAEETVSWRSQTRVLSMSARGTAELQEVNDDFEVHQSGQRSQKDAASQKLAQSLQMTLAAWIPKRESICRYKEAEDAEPSGIPSSCSPALQEDSPPLLSLWLKLALRPVALLPNYPVQLGASWQDPRAIQLPGWTDIQAVESGSWLAPKDAAEEGNSVRLLTVQQISGRVVPSAIPESSGNARASFHGESLTRVSLENGAMLSASRSASHELVWTAPLRKGSSHAPQFRAELEVQITMEECHGSCSQL